MGYFRSFTMVLVFLVIASTLLIPVDTSGSPSEPDIAPVINFRDWMKDWKELNMDPAAQEVHDAYKAFSGLVSAYQTAINDVGGTAFSSVSSAVQTSWVGMIVAVYNTTKDVATNIAKSETLESAVELAASHHSAYFYYYNHLFDKHGRVDRISVRSKIAKEIEEHGGILYTAETMMEAYYRYEAIVEIYNEQLAEWKEYNPSDTRQPIITIVPSKVLFKKFNCFGGCGYEHDLLDYARDAHKLKCGTGENVDDVMWRIHGHYRNDNDVKRELKQRTLAQGCGRPYYTCNTSDKATHEIQTCVKWVYQRGDYYGAQLSKSPCGISFRKCLLHTFDHHVDVPGESVHSTDPSAGGDGAAQTPSTPETAMHACGIHATTVSGSHSRITPPCGDSAHAGYACQISSDHNTEMPGWSGTFYECQPHTTYPCGHTDPTANAAYHAPKTCTLTNAQGDSCVATGLYACQSSHTCVYACGRSGCTQTVSSSTQHSATCASGHSYWTCKPYDVKRHITRTCRFSECGKSWQRCMTGGVTPICDKPWRKQNGLRCWQID